MEHGLATGGAKYLRFPGQGVPFYVRHNLDVAAAAMAMVTAMVMTIAYVSHFLMRSILRLAGRTWKQQLAVAGKKSI